MLKGKIFLITGAAGIIGRTTARLICDQNAAVFLVDRSVEGLAQVAATFPSEKVGTMVADIADSIQVRHVFAAAEARFGAIDGAVLAAAVEGPVAQIEDCDDEAFDAVMAVNVRGVWLSLKQCLMAMKPRGSGSVVILSSISGVGGSPLLAPYCASKHAVLGLMRTAAREAAASGVRVNAVCPGPVDSEMMQRIDGALSRSFPDRRSRGTGAAGAVPMLRYARPEEVGQMILFLCSDASSYCTGAAFMVDGGFSAK